MTTTTAPDINVENLDRQHDKQTDAAIDLGNDLLERAQEAESQQAALFETTPLESRYNGALAEYVEAKYEQVERLEDRLENLIEQEMANLESCQVHRPAGLFLDLARGEPWNGNRLEGKLLFNGCKTGLSTCARLRKT